MLAEGKFANAAASLPPSRVIPSFFASVGVTRTGNRSLGYDFESGSLGLNSAIAGEPFGETCRHEKVELFTLRDPHGLEVAIMTYGAAVQRLLAPDREGQTANVALGFPELETYLSDAGRFFGATIGRYANRIAEGRIVLDGQVHKLSRNEGRNCLHGGLGGFDTKVWNVVRAADGLLELAYSSPDGEMGFPGTLDVRVIYRLSGNSLRIDYEAVTSAPTVLNLTNHTCWNLSGEGSGPVDEHVLQVNASSFTPLDQKRLPTGKISPVRGTPLDFRRPTPIGQRCESCDHNFVIDRFGVALEPAAWALEPVSGRTLEVLTTEPGIQLYTGTFLDGALVGASGRPYCRGDCIALETQHFPDSPNQPSFPSTVLRPGQTFHSTTVYRFGFFITDRPDNPANCLLLPVRTPSHELWNASVESPDESLQCGRRRDEP